MKNIKDFTVKHPYISVLILQACIIIIFGTLCLLFPTVFTNGIYTTLFSTIFIFIAIKIGSNKNKTPSMIDTIEGALFKSYFCTASNSIISSVGIPAKYRVRSILAIACRISAGAYFTPAKSASTSLTSFLPKKSP